MTNKTLILTMTPIVIGTYILSRFYLNKREKAAAGNDPQFDKNKCYAQGVKGKEFPLIHAYNQAYHYGMNWKNGERISNKINFDKWTSANTNIRFPNVVINANVNDGLFANAVARDCLTLKDVEQEFNNVVSKLSPEFPGGASNLRKLIQLFYTGDLAAHTKEGVPYDVIDSMRPDWFDDK
mgnify:FL=1|tara:strand:+ start:4118 stop:4660 length:543 start_codon:yes stop_codon:yes gene_type:complete